MVPFCETMSTESAMSRPARHPQLFTQVAGVAGFTTDQCSEAGRRTVKNQCSTKE